MDMRMLLSEQMDLARLTVKSSAQDIQKLAVALTAQGCKSHVAPMRAAYGSLQDALRSLETGTINAGAELARMFADAIPGHVKGE